MTGAPVETVLNVHVHAGAVHPAAMLLVAVVWVLVAAQIGSVLGRALRWLRAR